MNELKDTLMNGKFIMGLIAGFVIAVLGMEYLAYQREKNIKSIGNGSN